MAPEPYKTTPVFDENSLPDLLRGAHNTKVGVWGLLQVLEGAVQLVFHDPPRRVRVAPGTPAEIPPQAWHHVETDGPMRMQVAFYHQQPLAHGDG